MDEAGPSIAPPTGAHGNAGPTETSTPTAKAPERRLPSTLLYSIEYPGYVQLESVPRAIETLGGQSSLDTAFRRGVSKTEALVELRFDPSNPFAHPIPGDMAPTNNIVLKVVRRKRKVKDPNIAPGAPIGEYKAEAIGSVHKTLRFRSMADYHYQPPDDDPVTQLRLAMDRMDVDATCGYSIPEDKGDYLVPSSLNSPNSEQHPLGAGTSASASSKFRSNLRFFPPPLFSRQTIPQIYQFKANPASLVQTTVDEVTGEEKKRLINRLRWKGYGPASILFSDPNTPDKPPAAVEATRKQVSQDILKRLQELFEERPVWTRLSLFNQFTPSEARDILNSKVLLPLVCYVFQDGPWRDTLVRFSYDPRKDPEARFYQRLYFRNAQHPIARPSVATRRQERSAETMQNILFNFDAAKAAERKRSHIFDGRTVTKETAAFQLCDIEDPMLKEMIEDEEDLRDTCDERDGWYSIRAMADIKAVLRHKFFSLLQGYIPSDEECQALLEEKPVAMTVRRNHLKVGKNNLAKGAARPEDIAAIRLQATLERNAKVIAEKRQDRRF
ncbi:hypothetical protein FISHEDRAFT_41503 [Fistulina hepatica ATCC 64428]|nr:hypothetical protein FISHEDRAFT_41503 [Fistulina hepatica ATCC 64428]